MFQIATPHVIHSRQRRKSPPKRQETHAPLTPKGQTMRVLVGSTWTTTDQTGTAGHVAATLATASGISGQILTLKADGIPLDPSASIPEDANLELIEHVSDTAAPSPEDDNEDT